MPFDRHEVRDGDNSAGTLLHRSASGDTDPLLRYLEEGPNGGRNHPTADHYLPLLVALGAGAGDRGRNLHDGYTYGVLSMAAYAWGNSPVLTATDPRP